MEGGAWRRGGDVIGCKQIERGRARRDAGCALRGGPPSAPGRHADSGSANARRWARPRAVSGESSDTSAWGGPGRHREWGGVSAQAAAVPAGRSLRVLGHVSGHVPRRDCGLVPARGLLFPAALLPSELRWVPASQPVVPSLLCPLLSVPLVPRGAPCRGRGAKPRCWAVRGTEPKGTLLFVGRAFPRGRTAALGAQKYPFWSCRRFLCAAKQHDFPLCSPETRGSREAPLQPSTT